MACSAHVRDAAQIARFGWWDGLPRHAICKTNVPRINDTSKQAGREKLQREPTTAISTCIAPASILAQRKDWKLVFFLGTSSWACIHCTPHMLVSTLPPLPALPGLDVLGFNHILALLRHADRPLSRPGPATRLLVSCFRRCTPYPHRSWHMYCTYIAVCEQQLYHPKYLGGGPSV